MHRRPAVLVVADDHPVRSPFCDVLEIAGVEALDAHDGYEALGVLSRRPDTDAVVLDLSMKWSEPKQLRMQLFRSARWRHVPLIVLANDVHDAFGLAADLVITKPWDTDAILRAVAELRRPAARPQPASP